MPSTWIVRRQTPSRRPRYIVRFRVGGRESQQVHAGSFTTLREAEARRRWVRAELAAMRVPDVDALRQHRAAPTVADAIEAWRTARIDIADSTRVMHETAAGRILPYLGSARIDQLTAEDVAVWISELADHGARKATTTTPAQGHKRATIRKSLNVLAQALDHAGLDPNPARDRRRVKLPHEDRPEVQPPSGDHVLAVLPAMAVRYRLPLLILEATGMRIGELGALTWGDVDERAGRWRVSRATAKTRRGRWVAVPTDLFAAVLARCPREDRDPAAPVLSDFGIDRFRTDLARACRATGTPAFSPHDLRHRRISLWHAEGLTWAEIGARVGQRALSVTSDTYTHVLVAGEVDRAGLV